MRRRYTLLAGLSATLLVGCSSASPTSVQTVVATVTQTVAVTPTTTTTPTDVSSTTDTTEPSPSPSTDDTLSTPSATLLGPQDKGRQLGLTDFFNVSSSWSESRFDVADRKDIQGLAAAVSNCNQASAEVLELRLSNSFSKLSFSVAQANDSAVSDQTLDVEVDGNNKQIDIHHIPFNQVQQFAIPVTGVNALKIAFYLDSQVSNCGAGSVRPVFFSSKLE